MILLSLLPNACKTGPESIEENKTSLIEITKEQFESEGMALGEPTMQLFAEKVSFTGAIVSSINGHAQVSMAIPGVVSSILCQQGQWVKKNEALFKITGNEFFNLQKDFAESAVMLKKLKTEFDRVKELTADNISTKKEYNQAESAYKYEKASYDALRLKLESIGIDCNSIEEGTFFSNYTVFAPIEGYVTEINATIGQFIEPQTVIVQIINNHVYRLKILVYEKDINKILKGQKVEFYTIDNQNLVHEAVIASVGTSLNESKSVECYARILNESTSAFVNNQFITGNIILASKPALAIPETAIISVDSKHFILSLVTESDLGFSFKKTKVITGNTSNNYVEIIEPKELNNLIIQGVYNIHFED